MERYELTDAQWAAVEPLLPAPTRRGGHPWRDHRQVLNGILWVLVTGAQWRAVPARYGPWSTCHDRFRRWRDGGLFDRVLAALHARLDAAGRVRPVAVARRRHERAGLPQRRRRQGGEAQAERCLGRSRGGFGTKLHVLACANGVPLAAVVTPGQSHECREVEGLLDLAPLRRPRRLAGDKGYSFRTVRDLLRRRGIGRVIPLRKGQPGGNGRFDRDAYRRRNAVERLIGRLKENRRVGTRHDKLAESYRAFVTLAMVRECWRQLELSDRP